MNDVDLGIWDKLTKAIVFLLVLSAILFVGTKFVPLIRQNEAMRKEILRLDDEIKREEETAKQLRVSLDALRTDPRTVERLAREKLLYAKPGETVIRFQSAPTNGVPASRP